MVDNMNKSEKEQEDVALLAKEKSTVLYNFYEAIKRGGEILSPEDIDIAIETLKLAQLDIKEREERKRNERDAELLKSNMEDKEKRRRAAEVRVAKRAEKKRIENTEETTAMELPLDYVNNFDEDERANIHCDSIAEGLLVSLDALGLVDIEFISSVTGEEMKTVIESLKGSIYQNPLHWEECYYKGWETSDEYLSGNLMHKLAIAEAANEEYPGVFDNNIKGLKDVISPNLNTDEIYVTLGSPWVPSDVIDDFILHLIGIDKIKGEYPTSAEPLLQSKYAVRHDSATGMWEIPEKTRFRKNHDYGKYEEYNCFIYGTNRMDMLYLLENILNMKTIAIYDYPDTDKKVKIVNQKETVKILEKQNKMIDEFKKWVWADEKRKARLQGAYCRRYGNIKKRVFDGSFLELTDMNPKIKLKKHQRDSIARIIFSPNTLLAHDVGAGKTYTMIAAGMELRRLGKSQKNLYVVPNNILAQWVEMFRDMYPNAKLLVVNNKNFCLNKRTETLKRIINDDFDAILMTYSCFDMLSLSKKYYQDFYKAKLKMLDDASASFHSKKDVERKKATIFRVLEKLQEDMSKNVCEIPFDELGINTLFLDEAHNYKNVPLESSIAHVKGFNKVGSRKCEGMMDKIHCVQRQNNGGRIVLATGTPITNSITDIFVLQKYLQDGELEFLGIQNFDSWVGMFAKKTTEFEIDIDTNSYHLASRFSRFYNVPELTDILSSVADFYHVDQTAGIPELDGYIDSVRVGSDDFKKFLREISARADDVRQKRVDKKVDNLLKITTDGRKAALDMRLIDLEYGFDIDSKVVRCAETVMDIYEKTRDKKLIQMVFCDSSTPKAGFNLYDELKRLLVAMGMPKDEIAFIHDADSEAKKKLLFHDLCNGTLSVVIGSTFKMGLGVNVQKRLCALHHLDVPWRPADMVQREGRILRQGNECDNVQIYRYITKGSFDAYSWQLLESKQKFISQILSGHVSVREGDDVDETVLNYAEVKALAVGNPLIKQRVELINELDKYKILNRDYIEERAKKKRILGELPEQIEKQIQRIENTKKDISFYACNKIDYKQMDYEEQKFIREKIYVAAKTHVNMPFEQKVLTYQGFDVVVPARMQPKVPYVKDENDASIKNPIPYVFVKRNGVYYMEIESLLGITKRLNNLLENLDDKRINQEKELERLKFKKETIEKELEEEDNIFIDEIEALTEKIAKINKELGLDVG
ncbi:MAG: hypothetical protein E7678_03350 [Ruminococcaceae bacterium]|nr:hypothetical protein [Oscillospiraceae bacterium]